MRSKILLLAFVVLVSCSETPAGSEQKTNLASGDSLSLQLPSKGELIAEIKSLEAKTLVNNQHLDDSLGHALLRKYQDYYNFYPRDEEAAQMLYKAADVARGLGKYKQAIVLLSNLHDGYPEFEERDVVAYQIAFAYESMGDTIQAIKSYSNVIALYSESLWANEARNNIELLKMTEAEMIQFLKEKNNPS